MLHADRRSLLTLGALTALALIAAAALALRGEETLPAAGSRRPGLRRELGALLPDRGGGPCGQRHPGVSEPIRGVLFGRN